MPILWNEKIIAFYKFLVLAVSKASNGFGFDNGFLYHHILQHRSGVGQRCVLGSIEEMKIPHTDCITVPNSGQLPTLSPLPQSVSPPPAVEVKGGRGHTGCREDIIINFQEKRCSLSWPSLEAADPTEV